MRGVAEEEADEALRYVARMGYLDDARFARQYVRQRAGRGIGRRRLLDELAVRGVDRDLAARVLDEAELGDEGDRALELARERARRGRTPEQTGRFLSGRGFAPGTIRRAVQQAYAEEAREPELS